MEHIFLKYLRLVVPVHSFIMEQLQGLAVRKKAIAYYGMKCISDGEMFQGDVSRYFERRPNMKMVKK